MSEHEDIKYLKGDDIAPVLMKGMAETYKAQPNNPVDFFAKWLLNHNNIASKVESNMKDKQKQILENKDAHEQEKEKADEEIKQMEIAAKEKEDSIKAFYDTFQKSNDLDDHLQELCDFIQLNTNATSVYIGKLAKPK
jgi:chromatin segregation and condensation protein Rec8/ScpA/Scc1 (kleisin family)